MLICQSVRQTCEVKEVEFLRSTRWQNPTEVCGVGEEGREGVRIYLVV